jgi:isoprenylcysteine carboxyl methyltransferase (ICMT) family protein YpbQ
MITEKATLMFIVFTLIQLVCVISVILCENNTIDWCIIGFQVLMILVQILITVFDIRKTIKTNK